jgi:prepilin-type N-terminal cleavage/methylation domain-containing protein
MKRSAYKSHNGFTLAEAMIAVVVLSIAAAGVILPFTAGASIRQEGMHRTLAAKLAADRMEEIVNTPFDGIVTKFDGYIENQGKVEKYYGGSFFTSSNYDNFSRQVTCEYFCVAQQSLNVSPCFIMATVSVSYKGNELISLTRLIGK